MVSFLLATALNCEDSQKLVEKIMGSKQSTLEKHELIEVLKTNTELGCYEGSESSK
tara:strand:- start:305 stop:472 length:168 start_codon:yes stop_codon:yes gene_type:complete